MVNCHSTLSARPASLKYQGSTMLFFKVLLAVVSDNFSNVLVIYRPFLKLHGAMIYPVCFDLKRSVKSKDIFLSDFLLKFTVGYEWRMYVWTCCHSVPPHTHSWPQNIWQKIIGMTISRQVKNPTSLNLS